MWTPGSNRPLDQFNTLSQRVPLALARGLVRFNIPESARRIGFPRYTGNSRTNDLKLLHTNLHPIRDYQLSYAPYTSNVVIDLANMRNAPGGG